MLSLQEIKDFTELCERLENFHISDLKSVKHIKNINDYNNLLFIPEKNIDNNIGKLFTYFLFNPEDIPNFNLNNRGNIVILEYDGILYIVHRLTGKFIEQSRKPNIDFEIDQHSLLFPATMFVSEHSVQLIILVGELDTVMYMLSISQLFSVMNSKVVVLYGFELKIEFIQRMAYQFFRGISKIFRFFHDRFSGHDDILCLSVN